MLPSTLYIMSSMHLQSLKLLCPRVKEKMHLQENTLYDLDLGKMLPSMTYAPQGWAVETTSVLISVFNRLKKPRSICQKVIITGQYESEWLIENSKGRFCGGLRYLYRFYVLSMEKRKKYCFFPAKGIFHGEISISIP